MRNRVTLFLTFLAIGALAPAHPSAGAVGTSLSHPTSTSRFGWAVDVYGDTVVVGAPGIGNGEQAGRAFVYRRSGSQFTRVAELVPSDSSGKDGFGHSVAIDHDTIVVGSANAYSIPSKAYVFNKPAGGWAGNVNEVVRLMPGAGAHPSRFGAAVALSAASPRTVAVGDEEHVFVYVEGGAGWSGSVGETAKLDTSPTGTAHDIGGSIAMDDSVIVTGDPDTSLHNHVCVFVRPATGWAGVMTENARLSVAGNPRAFGSVGLSGDHIVVGSSYEWVNGTVFQGRAHVYTRPATGWAGDLTPNATLVSSDGNAYDEFGTAVDIDGGVVVVGTLSALTDGTPNDGVYRFDEPAGGWSGTLFETAQLPRFSDAVFGSAVATHGGTTVVGDQLDRFGNFSGSAFAYLNDTDNDRVPDVTDNCVAVSNATQSDIDADGDGDACDDDDDADGVLDAADNCPALVNPSQLDLDADNLGDVCDPDDDGDLVLDGADNCPVIANASQADLDGDGQGDACDADDDGDSIADASDNCPLLSNGSQYDLDADDIGDRCDNDNRVAIDVRPGVDINNLRTAGRFVPVAVHSRAGFDAVERVDIASLRFGPTGTEAVAVGCRAADVNGDALADLVCDFEVSTAKFKPADTVGKLTGVTKGLETTTFGGSDSVRLSGPPR